jgi:hypothetical protein
MKNLFKIFSFLAIVAGIAIFAVSCNKNNDVNPATGTVANGQKLIEGEVIIEDAPKDDFFATWEESAGDRASNFRIDSVSSIKIAATGLTAGGYTCGKYLGNNLVDATTGDQLFTLMGKGFLATGATFKATYKGVNVPGVSVNEIVNDSLMRLSADWIAEEDDDLLKTGSIKFSMTKIINATATKPADTVTVSKSMPFVGAVTLGQSGQRYHYAGAYWTAITERNLIKDGNYWGVGGDGALAAAANIVAATYVPTLGDVLVGPSNRIGVVVGVYNEAKKTTFKVLEGNFGCENKRKSITYTKKSGVISHKYEAFPWTQYRR